MLKIFHVKGTRSIRPIWICEELNLEYETEIISFSQEYRSSTEWRKINPVGKVPAMIDGKMTMFESGAMVQYLIDKYGNGRLQPKVGTCEQALYLQWCWFSEATFSRPLGEIVNHKRVFNEDQQSEAMIREMQARARLCMKAIDEALVDKEYICGDNFTAADVMLGYSVMLCLKLAPTENCRRVNIYWNKLQQRDAYKRAIEK